METVEKNLPSLTELSALLKSLKPNIGDEYRASDDPDDNRPGLCVTIGWTPETGRWSDNSFSGGAYHHPVWAVVSLYRRSNSLELARDIQDELCRGTF